MRAWSVQEHERGLARFVIHERRKRFVALLDSPRMRAKLRARMPHFSDLDQHWCEQVPPAKAEVERAWLLDALKSAGSPERCYLLSEDAELDGSEVALAAALHHTLLEGYAGLASCIPGRLGFFVGEDPGVRWLLRRPG